MRNVWLSISACIALHLPPGGIQAQNGFLNTAETAVQETDMPAPIVQWAYRVQGYSSQDGYNAYSAKQVLGEPDKWPACGDAGTAWAPGDATPGEEGVYIRVAFKEAMPIRQVMVAETNRAGCVEAIYLIDRNRREHEVFRQQTLSPEAEDSLRRLPGRMLRVTFKETRFKVYAAKVVLRTREGWNRDQIDAIGISTGTDAWQPEIAITQRFEFPGAVTPLDNTVNSAYTEVLPRLSPDGERLYFCRKNHPGNYGNHTNDDIWYAERQADGHWGTAQPIGWPLNDENHNYVCSVGDDGLLTLGNGYTVDREPKAGVSQSFQSGGKWVEPLNLIVEGLSILNLNAEYYLSRDRRTLILAMESWDSEGGKDLYVSFSDDELHFSRPVSMGFAINSGGQEMAPFLSDDGRHVFFSSDGFPGYGGQDVFVAERLDDSWTRWSAPENLGPSVNSPAWDAYFYYHAGTDRAYLASNRGNIANEDLYEIVMTPQRDGERQKQRLEAREAQRQEHLSDIGWSAEDVIAARRAQAREQGDAWALAEANARAVDAGPDGSATSDAAATADAGNGSSDGGNGLGAENGAGQRRAGSGDAGGSDVDGSVGSRAAGSSGSTPEAARRRASNGQTDLDGRPSGSADMAGVATTAEALLSPAGEDGQAAYRPADPASGNGTGLPVQTATGNAAQPDAENHLASGNGARMNATQADAGQADPANSNTRSGRTTDTASGLDGMPSGTSTGARPGSTLQAHTDAEALALRRASGTDAAQAEGYARNQQPGQVPAQPQSDLTASSPTLHPAALAARTRYAEGVPADFVDPRFTQAEGGEDAWRNAPLPENDSSPAQAANAQAAVLDPAQAAGLERNPTPSLNPWNTDETASDPAGAFGWEASPPRPQTAAEREAALQGLPLPERARLQGLTMDSSALASLQQSQTDGATEQTASTLDALGPYGQNQPTADGLLILYGGVYNAVDGTAVTSRIAFHAPEKGRIDMQTDSSRAFYTVGVRRGQPQEVVVQAHGYFTERFRFTPRDPEGKGRVREDFELIPIREGQTISLDNIYFDVNSSVLQPESFTTLDRWAEILSNHPGVVVQVQGHTNNLCSPRFCQELSQKRARSVSQYLAERGVAPGSLRFRGFGSKSPVADNNSTKGRAKNQRVELKILKAQ